ncbi:MAG TPA: hypothetical protein VH518_02365 [Tepidisphaeraceae bacterium]|jgi:hypothetical protein
MSDYAYSAVWRDGTGAQFWRVGLALDVMAVEDAAFMVQGLRMSVLRPDGDRLAAVWRPGSGAQFWHTGLDADEFKKKDEHFFNQDLRLVSFFVDADHFTALWRPGTGAQRWQYGLTFEQFKEKDKHFFDEGLRLVTMCRHFQGTFGQDLRFAGVWRAGSGGQHWLTLNGNDAGLKQFEKENQQHFDAGLRLVALTGNGLSAVWRAGTDAQAVRTILNFHDLKKTDEEYFKLGMRLVDLDEGLYLA